MKIISSLTRYFFAPLMVLLLTAAMVGCSDDKEELQPGDGYAQFKLLKSASYNKTRAAEDKLEYLSEAKKMQVVLLHNNVTITQTVVLDAYNSSDAEFGLRSDKLKLVAGEYQLIGYYLFDKVEKQILAGEPAESTSFVVTAGGLIVQDVLVNVVERGMIDFVLVKEFQKTRTVEMEEPFQNIYRFNVRVKNVETKQEVTFRDIRVKYEEGFDANNELMATATIDTVLYLKAGTYQYLEYHLFAKDSKNQTLGYSNEFSENQNFTVKDNEVTKANLPVKVGLAPYLKDYVALKEIWESLQGEEWSYVGELYPRGANWNFDKQLDMWGQQPGVSLDSKGRVTALNIGGFGPKGHLSPMIGDLEKLKVLTIGTHNDVTGGGPIEQYGGNPTVEQLKVIRNDYYNKFLAPAPDTKFAEPVQPGSKQAGAPNNKKQRGDISLLDVQFGELTNGVESIPAEIGNLTELQQLYIANGKIAELPSTMANLGKLTDLEIYNCPMMTKFPVVLKEIPELIVMILATNKQWESDVLYRGLNELALYGKSQEKLQLLYLGNNNLKALPASFANFKKLGKLDCVNNQISVIESAFPSTTNIVQLTMDYNKITRIPRNSDGLFCGFANVETISFSNNELTELPDMFDAKAIYVLGGVNFSYNKITSIENANGDYKGINASSVDLSYNQLTDFPSILIKSGSPITTLVLAGNGIDKFPKGSLDGANAFMLKTIDLKFNKLSKLPEDFYATKLPYLYGLDLSYNRFTAFPYEALDITNLTVFIFQHQRDAEGNRCMREWPKGVYKHLGLRTLLLGSNDIRRVEDDQISSAIFNLDISDNPNIIIDVSDICPYISAGYFNLMYDKTQDIRGCNILGLQ